MSALPRLTAERSAHRLYAQVLWTTLDELPLVGPGRAAAIEGHLIALCRRLDVDPVAVSVTSDRVHLLLRFKPTQALSRISARLKRGSAGALKGRGTPVRWGAGYAAATVGPAEVRRLMREMISRAERFASAHGAAGDGRGTPPSSAGSAPGAPALRPRSGPICVLTRLPPPE